MDNSERDTHFQGFAQLLWDELKEFDPYDFDLTAKDSWQILHNGEGFDPSILEEHIKRIIAQRAYDLAIHVTNHTRGAISRDPNFVIRHNVPDFTEWPPTPPEP